MLAKIPGQNDTAIGRMALQTYIDDSFSGGAGSSFSRGRERDRIFWRKVKVKPKEPNPEPLQVPQIFNKGQRSWNANCLLTQNAKKKRRKKKRKREKPLFPSNSANLYLKRMTVKLFQKKNYGWRWHFSDFENRKCRAQEFILWWIDANYTVVCIRQC